MLKFLRKVLYLMLIMPLIVLGGCSEHTDASNDDVLLEGDYEYVIITTSNYFYPRTEFTFYKNSEDFDTVTYSANPWLSDYDAGYVYVYGDTQLIMYSVEMNEFITINSFDDGYVSDVAINSADVYFLVSRANPDSNVMMSFCKATLSEKTEYTFEDLQCIDLENEIEQIKISDDLIHLMTTVQDDGNQYVMNYDLNLNYIEQTDLSNSDYETVFIETVDPIIAEFLNSNERYSSESLLSTRNDSAVISLRYREDDVDYVDFYNMETQQYIAEKISLSDDVNDLVGAYYLK